MGLRIKSDFNSQIVSCQKRGREKYAGQNSCFGYKEISSHKSYLRDSSNVLPKWGTVLI